MKKYRKKNPLKRLVLSCCGIDKKFKRECDITEKYLQELLIKQDNKCNYCKHILDINTGDKKLSQISVDRINNKLGHIEGNCVFSCLFCNRAKNNMDEKYFIEFINVLKNNNANEIKNKYIQIIKINDQIHSLLSSCYKYDKKKKSDSKLISSNEIKELFEKQNNCCSITGLPLINANIMKFPFKMSLDRIDNSKLHISGNCQLVCMAIQFGRGDKSVEEVKKYINEIRAIK